MASRPWLLLHGEETFLVERALALVRRPEKDAGAARAETVVWGDEGAERIAAALEDLVAPRLFGGQSRLVLRRVEHLNEAAQDHLLEVLPRLGASTQVVLVGGAVDLRRRLFAYCQREGGVLAFPVVADRRELRDWVVRLARERGREIAAAAADMLLDRTGSSLGALAGEIEKLSLPGHAGTRIDDAEIRRGVAATRDHVVAELTDHIARRDAAEAVRCLRQLLDDGEPAPRILAFVAANCRRALQVAELRERGCAPAEIARRLGMPAWLVERNVGRGSSAGLAAAMIALRDADVALKSARAAEAVFEQAVLQLARG
jgi:DNA polymerase III delta subunit